MQLVVQHVVESLADKAPHKRNIPSKVHLFFLNHSLVLINTCTMFMLNQNAIVSPTSLLDNVLFTVLSTTRFMDFSYLCLDPIKGCSIKKSPGGKDPPEGVREYIGCTTNSTTPRGRGVLLKCTFLLPGMKPCVPCPISHLSQSRTTKVHLLTFRYKVL